jgi:protein-L-isoaspartate(D-aspartate) O-methyltransferase
MTEKKALIEYWRNSKIITSKAILRAFEEINREDFVLPEYRKYAYVDEPLPTFSDQTISQPTTVAIMTQALEPKPGQKILEIGSGSGYQAAILSEIIGPEGKLITIERIPELAKFAKKNLKKYKNVQVIRADGSKGYAKGAPYDRIIVTAAAKKMPEVLFEQLKENGIMIIPVGAITWAQRLLKVKKVKGKKGIEDLGPFVFVPLVGSS